MISLPVEALGYMIAMTNVRRPSFFRATAYMMLVKLHLEGT